MKTFEKLLYPVSSAQFLTDNWCKTPLYLSRGNEGLDDLVSLEEVDEYLGMGRVSFPFVKVVRNGAVVDSRFYCHDQADPYLLIDRKKMFKFFSEGSTIALQVSHLTFPKLRAFTHCLEQELGIRIHANLYLTPSNSQGFYPHIDPHEVFAVQVAGVKNWNIFDRPTAFPSINQQLSAEEQERYRISKPAHEVVMNPGDLLYIPRGVVHDAFTSNNRFSLHITFGFHPIRQIDLVKLMLERMEHISAFREYLFPLGQSLQLNSDGLSRLSLELNDILFETMTDIPAKRISAIHGKYYLGDDHLTNLIGIDGIGSQQQAEEFNFEVSDPNYVGSSEAERQVLARNFNGLELALIKSTFKSLLINGIIKVHAVC